MMSFIEQNKISGFIFGGDALDMADVSPHTRNKPGLRTKGGVLKHLREFDDKCLKPLEAILPKGAEKVWLDGNHEHWLDQFVDEHPEWDGMQPRIHLKLADRGWNVKECGLSHKVGKIRVIHGETLSGIGNQVTGTPAKKALSMYCGSILAGHFHSLQVQTQIMPHDVTQRWAAYISPCMSELNPAYVRNRPNSFINGVTLLEVRDGGDFNVYPCVTTRGAFSFGGKVYKG
jgi:hypothetical protein